MSLKSKYIDALQKSKSLLIKSIDEEPFTLRSGKQSYIFINQTLLALHPQYYRAFVDVIQSLLEAEYGANEFILCNVDSKISPQLAGSLASQMSKSMFIYRPDSMVKAEKGATSQLTGDRSLSLPLAIVDDVVSTIDGTSKKIADRIHQEFTAITNIQIFVGLARAVGKTTYKTHYVLTYDELVDSVWKTLSEGQRKAVEKERSMQ